MNKLLEAQLAPTLARLEQFWLLKRKPLVSSLQEHIKAADAHTIQLTLHRNAIKSELSKKNLELARWQSAHQSMSAAHGQLQSDHANLSTSHARQSITLEKLVSAQAVLDAAHAQLQLSHAAQIHQLGVRDTEYRNLSALHSQMRSRAEHLYRKAKAQLVQLEQRTDELVLLQHAHAQLQATHQSLAGEHSSLQGNHTQLQATHSQLVGASQVLGNRYDLVCSILGCEPAENPALAELKNWLAGEFAQEIQQLELPADATTPALEQAQAIGQHAELLAGAPMLHNKFLVAVAGGFSSGKSSFVSSFMAGAASDLLPTGIQPVTAIPTYVMPGKELTIEGHTFKGAYVPLTPEVYGQLKHDFIKEMGFNIKEIMPYVVIQAPMPKLEHMAFIDIPGYDPAQSDVADTAADQGIASKALNEADAVIWLLGIDVNGTLPYADLAFLLDHSNGSKPLHVVLNKADLRPMESIEPIMQDIQQHLDEAGISYEGISAYSSILGEELLCYGNSLAQVMQQWDHFSSAEAAVQKDFATLMDTLEAAAQAAHENTENVHSLLHSLRLDIHELSAQQEAGVGASFSKLFTEQKTGNGKRQQQLRETTENKLRKIEKALAGVEWNQAAHALEKTRVRGHQLLQQSCGIA